MFVFLILLAVLSLLAVVATVVHVSRDGYGHIRSLPRRSDLETAADRARVL